MVVPDRVPYQSLDQLVQAWKAGTQGTPVGVARHRAVPTWRRT